ncbi:MAG TPA: radical SAM protein [Rhodospirillales bacterium]|nr:radical SAM protein [Rhodospirillales bacterium]
MPSPYLNGILDPFLADDFLPGIQTSRLCPYTCSFCVSGKTRGKLRGFDLNQVKEELEFVARTYADRPQMEMHINDENFGILRRDGEIADHVIYCHEKYGYPQSVFFYHDKRLVDTTRQVLTRLAPLSINGVTIPLQTESPEALKAAKRKGLTSQQLADVVDWASQHELFTCTELIFGLPGETAESFATSLDSAIERGFDSVLCNTLFIVDGIELNRTEQRQRLNIKTRYRQIRENYGMVEGEFCAEVEEVVVSTSSFDIADFLDVRKISMMFYTCFNMRFHYWLMSHFRLLGLPVTHLVRTFLDAKAVPQGPWHDYAVDFEDKAMGELYQSADQLRDKLRNDYVANGYDVGATAQLNIAFGARLIYQENDWVDSALVASAGHHINDMADQDMQAARLLIDLYRRERTDVINLKLPAPLETRWDVLAWRDDKFQKPLATYRLDHSRHIGFSFKPSFLRKYENLRADLGLDHDQDFFINLFHRIGSRSDLLLQLDYV